MCSRLANSSRTAALEFNGDDFAVAIQSFEGGRLRERDN